jgi:hypothetical protein
MSRGREQRGKQRRRQRRDEARRARRIFAKAMAGEDFTADEVQLIESYGLRAEDLQAESANMRARAEEITGLPFALIGQADREILAVMILAEPPARGEDELAIRMVDGPIAAALRFLGGGAP